MFWKNWNLYIVCILIVSAGCFGSRVAANPDGDGGQPASEAPNSDDDGGQSASEAPNSDDDGGQTASKARDTSVLGTWIGREIGESSGDVWTFEFSRSEAHISTSGIEAYMGPYQINTDVVPHQADFYIESSPISSLVGTTSLGIFLIEDNVMTLAAAAPGHPVRPERFEPTSDGMVRVWELERL